jgi:hypothetical protein
MKFVVEDGARAYQHRGARIGQGQNRGASVVGIRETVNQILRGAPFDLGGDVITQRPLLEQMLTSASLPEDVRATKGDLGGVRGTRLVVQSLCGLGLVGRGPL